MNNGRAEAAEQAEQAPQRDKITDWRDATAHWDGVNSYPFSLRNQ
jgi:hypothetical protein